MRLLEINPAPAIYSKIAEIFKTELERFDVPHLEVRTKHTGSDGRWLDVVFWNTEKNYSDNSLGILVAPNGDVGLMDVYVPAAIRNKGYLTGVLKKIRHLPGISGKLTVHVGMDQKGWKTIAQRSGFEWLPAGYNKAFGIEESLSEAPLEDVKRVRVGPDKEESSQLKDLDKPEVLATIKKALDKVKQKIYFYFVRGVTFHEVADHLQDPKASRKSANPDYYLRVAYSDLLRAVTWVVGKEQAENFTKPDPSAINVYFLENKLWAGDGFHVTSWGFVHDFVHAITLAPGFKGRGTLHHVDQLIEKFARSYTPDPDGSVPEEEFVRKFVTTKSRDHLATQQIEELSTELFTQYLFKGEVVFAKADAPGIQRALDKLKASIEAELEKLLAVAAGKNVFLSAL